jgi:outer membrane usher protein
VVLLGSSRPQGITYGREGVAFLNYAIHRQEPGQVSALGEAGLNLGGGFLLGRFSRQPDGSFLRDLTSLTLDDGRRLRRWVIGDNVAGGGPLGGTASLAGVSMTRDFGLDPYFIRQPVLGSSAIAPAPSTLETYVNGHLVHRQQVPPGPVELRNLPVTSGHGSLRVVIRDRFGGEQELLSTFYFAPQLLAPGISEYGYSVGFRRNRLATANGDYGDLAFLGRHRVGLTRSVTTGAHLETASRLISGGTSLTAGLPFGQLDLSAAASRREGLGGGAASLAFSYLGRPLGFGATVQRLSDRWATLSLMPGDDRAALAASASAALQVGSRSSLGLRFSRTEYRSAGRSDRLSLVGNIRLLKRTSLFVSGSRPLEGGRAEGDQISLQVSCSPGALTTAGVSHEIRDGRGATLARAQRSLPIGTGYGYRIEAPLDRSDRANTVLQYQGPHGRYEASFDGTGRSTPRTVSISGGVVAIGRRIHLTRTAQQGMALLRVPGLPGVRAYLNRQEVGRTNGRGELVIPNLLPYYGNRLTIEDKDIPPAYDIGANERVVAPPFGGAVQALFPVKRLQSLSGTLVVEFAGQRIVPAYGQLTVTVDGKPVVSPLGKQGEFYLEDVPPGRYPAEVEYQNGVCRFELSVPASDDPILDLGTVVCSPS